MKPLKDIRINYDLRANEVSVPVKQLKRYIELDFDMYLPTKGKNLQRGFVWTLFQKRELIKSIFVGRHIPNCTIINAINREDEKKDIHLVLDGKQRLSTILEFLDDKFSYEDEGKEYLFSQLPEEYRLALNNYWIRYWVINEPWETKDRISDDQKIEWFKFINFAGTPQDIEHLSSLV